MLPETIRMRTERMKRAALRRRAAGLLLALLLTGCAAPASHPPATFWEGDVARVELECRQDALAVFAAGDFNQWNPERHPFIEMEDGYWTCTLRLAPGRYAYLLAIETETGWSWRLDENNPARMRDVLGRELSLLIVNGDAGADSVPPERQGR